MDKAPGVDEPVPRFLAALSDEISVPLNIIYNRSLSEGEVPNDWRDANVSPILANVNSSSCSLYVIVRPSVVCRLSSVCLSSVCNVRAPYSDD